MIAEGLQALLNLHELATKPVDLSYLGLGGRAYAMGGEVYEMPPPLRRRQVGSLDDLIAAVKREVDIVTDDTGDVEPGPDCWVSMSGVTALWRANDSREYVVFPLCMSQAWTLLRSWAATPQMLEQKAFIRTLVQVFDCDPALIAPWRKLDFLSSVKTAGEVERGRDRLGREINSQASGAVDLPETLPVTVPIFREQGQRETYTVLCRVEIDAAANRIGLLVKDSDLSAIEESHLAGLLEKLRKELADVPCYLGHVL